MTMAPLPRGGWLDPFRRASSAMWEAITRIAETDGWSSTKKFCVMVAIVQLPILLLVIGWVIRLLVIAWMTQR